MLQPSYVRVDTDTKTRCSTCFTPMSLLQHKDVLKCRPMFYICWRCKQIYEIGKGLVENDV